MIDTIRVVIATRMKHADFMNKSATGRTLRLTSHRKLELIVTSENQQGLPKLYNQIIKDSVENPAVLVFAHDDLHFLDYHWCHHLVDGLKEFDIVGLVGNRRRISGQVSWAFVNDKFEWDDKVNLSGVIAHGRQFPPDILSRFGDPRQEVKLLDGMFIAARSETLINNSILFDERFDFHFYDMDFCRQAEVKKLRCGTWDISMIHESSGGFDNRTWFESKKIYFDKWGE